MKLKNPVNAHPLLNFRLTILRRAFMLFDINRTKGRLALGLALIFLGVSCMQKNKKSDLGPHAPIATEKIQKLEKHGDVRFDPYFWMKERDTPAVLSYLKNENDYVDTILKPQKKLQENLFTEMRSRIKEDDSSAPYKKGSYQYFSKFSKGEQYPKYYRMNSSKKELLFNTTNESNGFTYFHTMEPIISPNNKWMAIGIDNQGRRFYNFRFKNLMTGKFLNHEIKSVTPQLLWAEDNKHVFYVKQDPISLRAYQVFRLNIETKKNDLIFEEKDETFSVEIYESILAKYLYISSSSTLSSEIHFIPKAKPLDKPKVILPRQENHEYHVTDDDTDFYILSNEMAPNFKLLKVPQSKFSKSNWKELISHSEKEYLNSILVFKNQMVLRYTADGLPRIRVYEKKSAKSFDLNFSDSDYDLDFGPNKEFNSSFVRIEYESPRQPTQAIDYSIKTGKSIIRKTRSVPNFSAMNYTVERLWSTSRDGTKVPITILRKTKFEKNGSSPLLMIGYGSYGLSYPAHFSSSIFSLVDRGFVVATAHIRGGGEMGRHWYDQGRVLNKKNTFNDFIDCTEFLLKNGYADKSKIYAIGGSAGGLLMGAVMNMRPDLYHGLIAHVPFVDVITTMLDDSIPLTTAEYDEWGNPNEKKYYDYMKSYSPYDQVVKTNYPHLMVTTGYHDSQVQYWEPAKWVAKIRKNNTSKSIVLFRTDFESGHGGASGRFDHLEEIAREYAFILMTMDLARN